MFGLFKRKPVDYFSESDKQLIADAIHQAEQRTSGEVRIYIESHCEYVDPVLRAKEVFLGLKMFETEQRNGVLVYVAMKDRQLAVYGDDGIHNKVGNSFWDAQVQKMIHHFNSENFAIGISEIILEIGEALKNHFPYDAATDKNELPDDIVFGN